MDKIGIVKKLFKVSVMIGTDFMLGFIGGGAVAMKTGVTQTVAKVVIPITTHVYTGMLTKKTDAYIDETVDKIVNDINKAKDESVVKVEKTEE